MRPFDLTRERPDYEPPSSCHDFGVGEGLAALIGTSAAEAAGASAGTVALTGAGDLAAATAGAWASVAPPSLSTVGTVASLAGSGISALSSLRTNAAAADQQRYEAALLAQKANSDAAAGEQVQI